METSSISPNSLNTESSINVFVYIKLEKNHKKVVLSDINNLWKKWKQTENKEHEERNKEWKKTDLI